MTSCGTQVVERLGVVREGMMWARIVRLGSDDVLVLEVGATRDGRRRVLPRALGRRR